MDFILLIIPLGFFIRRVYIRHFWTATEARIVNVPQLSGWSHPFQRIPIEVEYETEKDVLRQTCNFPKITGVGGKGGHSPDEHHFWDDGYRPWMDIESFVWERNIGNKAIVHYPKSNPEHVVFLGGSRRVKNKIEFTQGTGKDCIFLAVFLILLFLAF